MEGAKSRVPHYSALKALSSKRDVKLMKFFFWLQERRKEKRRLQDQLRRIRRNELKAKLFGIPIGQPITKVGFFILARTKK